MQQELGLTLEHFAPGPDGGIDLRHIGRWGVDNPSIVIQCKRWAEDSFRPLLRRLTKEELPKIGELNPRRYILMTSVKLNPARKDMIVYAMKPWILSAKDIIGRDDISGLLAKHNEVERRHIKLWLTSSEVLDALLNSGIFYRSEEALRQVKQQLRLWVPNPSFSRAREILDANRVCIISGAPGIGKNHAS